MYSLYKEDTVWGNDVIIVVSCFKISKKRFKFNANCTPREIIRFASRRKKKTFQPLSAFGYMFWRDMAEKFRGVEFRWIVQIILFPLEERRIGADYSFAFHNFLIHRTTETRLCRYRLFFTAWSDFSMHCRAPESSCTVSYYS